MCYECSKNVLMRDVEGHCIAYPYCVAELHTCISIILLVVASLIDAAIYHSTKAIQQKMELGKFS